MTLKKRHFPLATANHMNALPVHLTERVIATTVYDPWFLNPLLEPEDEDPVVVAASYARAAVHGRFHLGEMQ